MSPNAISWSSCRLPPDPNRPLLEVQQVTRHYRVRRGLLARDTIKAVDDVSLTLMRGEALGIVGESGCGKSSLARLLVSLDRPTSGKVRLDGQDVHRLRGRSLVALRRRVQMVFQDPYASLHPRMTVEAIVGEAFDLHPEALGHDDRRQRVQALLALVGLAPEHLDRYPHQFSGGQRQRIGIARALALQPELVVLDEPVSALDVSVQAQVINLLQDLRRDLGLTYVLISHDLSIIGHTCSQVAVMYLGRIVELGPMAAVLDHATHPYTQALLSAAVHRSGTRIILEGDIDDPAHVPSGCRFRTRCWKARDICAELEPVLERHGGAPSLAACHFTEERADIKPADPGGRLRGRR